MSTVMVRKALGTESGGAVKFTPERAGALMDKGMTIGALNEVRRKWRATMSTVVERVPI